jgi:hypothetical protein
MSTWVAGSERKERRKTGEDNRAISTLRDINRLQKENARKDFPVPGILIVRHIRVLWIA